MKNVIVAIALMFSVVAVASAQTAPAEVTVNAYLAQQTLTWSNGAAATLNFGSASSPIVVPATTAQTTINPNSSSNAATLTLTGSAGAAVSFTYPSSIQLQNANNKITYTADIVGSNSSSSQNGATTLNTGSLSSDNGNYYIWIGGNLGNLSGTTPAGTYQGKYQITVSYGS